MKTSRIIFMLALAAAATACNKAELEDTDPVVLKSNQFLASLEGATTKVTMAGDFTLTWVKGDQVSVFDEEGSNLVFTAATDGAAVTLEGDDVVVDAAKTYYAIYPYSDGNSIENGVITTVIPTVQTPKKGDIPVNFAVAKNDERTFSFYNVCGLVGFEITESDIVSVTVKANGTDEYLTGKVKVTPSAAPSYEVAEGVSEVTLVAEGKAFEAGYHYVAVLPQAFENGITVLMTKADGTVASKTTTKAFTLSRSHRIDTKQIDASQSWTKLTSISNAAELQGFLAAAGSYTEDDVVTLADDIDLSGYDIVPAASFAGTFDGADKSITNWNTTTALFNEVTGTVKNLNIAESCNLEVQVKGDAAFIVLANAGTISGCKNYGTVTSVKDPFMEEVESTHNDRMTGTIAAVSTGVVKDCENHGIIKITPNSIGKYTRQYVGGVVGQFKASAGVVAVENCTNNASVSIEVVAQHSGKLFVGGVCGGTPAGSGTFDNYGSIEDCTNSAAVSVSAKGSSGSDNYLNLGGVIGYAEASLDNCDNTAAVSAIYPVELSSTNTYVKRPAVGGVAGTVLLNADNCSNSGTVTLKGAVGKGSEKVGMGFRDGAYVGGIAAVSGHLVSGKLATNTMTSCTNSGNLDIELNMPETAGLTAYIGGISGSAMARVTECTNTGSLDIKNRLNTGYAGGIVGMLGDSANLRGYINSCSNDGAINYDAVVTNEVASESKQSKDVRIGGVAGRMDYFDNSDGAKFLKNHNNANGILTLRNGASDGTCYVGGLIGYNGKNIVAGENSDEGRLMSSGNIEVDTRMTAYVGGVFGRTAHQIIDVKANMDAITVTSPGANSMVGGICGDRQSGGTGDARMYVESNTNITVTCQQDNGTHFGLWNGRRAETDKRFHTTYFKGNATYENVTFGVLVGYLTKDAVINVGTSGNVNIASVKINGADLPIIQEDELDSKLFGTIEDGATITYVAGKLIQ